MKTIFIPIKKSPANITYPVIRLYQSIDPPNPCDGMIALFHSQTTATILHNPFPNYSTHKVKVDMYIDNNVYINSPVWKPVNGKIIIKLL